MQTVGTSEPIPNWAFFATRKANPNKSNKVLQALLRLKPGSEEASVVLGLAHLTGFVLTADQDYDPMRKAGQAAGVL
ncbi:MAG: PhnD/SsuA/transferrin family substrate-binding protein [Nitrospirae bacterium]|nr:PhnD/SsuA/transferrin family substrate-binding protein [Nitrospirota bacterium]